MTSIELSKSIYHIKGIKFGDFTLKSGLKSPIYLDLRQIISYPLLLNEISKQITSRIPTTTQRICGVPYAALPLATIVSQQSTLPLIIKRKESKQYGTKKIIEGEFQSNDEVLLIEDVITSGESLIETINELEKEGLKINKIITIVDRQQGGVIKLKQMGYDVECLITITNLIELLYQQNLIDYNDFLKVKDYLSITKFPKTHQHPKGQKLIDICRKKQTNLIASVDLTRSKDILDFVTKIGDDICAVKLHCDIIEDFNQEFIKQLKELSFRKEFLIIEDRKFADIGNTQILQLTKGIYAICNWADFITIHLISGESALKAFQELELENKPGLIPILEMSSEGALTDLNYINNCKNFLYNYSDVVGVVCQSTPIKNTHFKFTPGVSIIEKSDNKGQQYNTPDYLINQFNSQFLIIGRGLYESKDPKTEVKKYLTSIRQTKIFD